MARAPITGMVVLSAALVAATGAALDVNSLWVLLDPPPVENRAVALTPPILPSSTNAKDQGLAAAKDVVALQSSPLGDGEPAFDIARIEPSGDAVIAGRAAPGASVELLRSGEVHDRVVADPSGQFIIVPHRLPTGEYELTLRSRQDDGKSATSKEKVLVSLSSTERPVVTMVAPTGARTELSKPLTSPRRSAFRGSARFTGIRHNFRGRVAASHFRRAYGRYQFGGDGYSEYLYSGYEYGYRCWVTGPNGRSGFICY
jgi:hypothetical protein